MMKINLPRSTLTVLVGAILGCTGPEEKLINRFLEASREKDLATLSETSMVSFPGAIQSWRIEGTIEERQEAFLLNDLQKQLDKARRIRVGHHQALRQFRREHKGALDDLRSKLSEDPNFAAKGEDPELFSTWQEMENADREAKSKLDSARNAVELEREGARKSLNTWTPIDEFDGDVLVRDVLVSVDPGAGQPIAYVFTLKQYTLEHQEDHTRPEAGWILMGIREKESSSE
jgi:hypothetical protein